MEFDQFPTTRYQGSKRKILPWIYNVVKDLEFETVLDACGGTASVSYLFKKMNKAVTYNDKLKFNYLIGKAIIENSRTRLTQEDEKNLLHQHSTFLYERFIEKTFDDIYFLPNENRWLDKVVANINQMNHYEANILEYKKCLAYYALFQASMIKRPFNLFHRKNLYLRTNNAERTFGNKATWDKTFKSHFKTFIGEGNSSIFNSGVHCSAMNKSLIDIDEIVYDLVYIDTPYLSKTGINETADYLRCYHFLEGLANYHNWKYFIDHSSLNLRFDKPVENEFSPKKIHKTFKLIFEKFERSKLIVSYKKGGIPSIDFLVSLMKKFKRNVRTETRHYKYALNKQNGDATKNREVLIIGI